jgi:hypothetical protein
MHFLVLVEREREWCEVLMAVALSIGATAQFRMILVERCR